MIAKSHSLKIGIVGTGQRAEAYAYLLSRSASANLAGLCDNDAKRLESFAKKYEMQKCFCTTDLSALLFGDKIDAVIITVPDRFHRPVAEACYSAGKHVLLEKPMALTSVDCRAIIRAKERSGCALQIGFVLRCTAFYRKIKDIVDGGVLGQMMSVSATEYLGVSHSMSYMRRWHRKSENSGSFLLAKCSHDLDLLSWIIGDYPCRVASFGSNNFFLPCKQVASHCSKCADKKCRFRFDGQFVMMTPADRLDPSARDFDLCVYNSDKDVVDSQVCILEYPNGVRAQFTLGLFRARGTRKITVVGSDAYLEGDFDENTLSVLHSKSGVKEVYRIAAGNGSGHGGGDMVFIDQFVSAIRSGSQPVADMRDGVASTVIGEALESARREGKVVAIPAPAYELPVCQKRGALAH